MNRFFDSPIMKINSTVATLLPANNIMYFLDTDFKGGDKLTYNLWMDLASRNPSLMMNSIPTPRETAGHFQFAVSGKENIDRVIELMQASLNNKFKQLAEEVKSRYSDYFDETPNPGYIL